MFCYAFKKTFYGNQSRVRLNSHLTFTHYTLYDAVYCSKSLIIRHWNHFINTSPSTETIQDVFVTVKTCEQPALQAHAPSSRQRPEYS